MKIVCISDTHTMHKAVDVPDGDVLIHAGDITGRGDIEQIREFCEWLDQFPHKTKIVIAGNHDWCFQRLHLRDEAIANINSVATYLEDSSIVIDGVKFYGAPWQPEFCDWAFNVPRGEEIAAKWDMIEPDTNVLVTHGPPHKILDWCPGGHVGCEDLLAATARLDELKYHVFGHIHESHGTEKFLDVTYINASNCDGNYRPINPAIVFDYDEGVIYEE